MSKKALLVTRVSGFVPQFEMNNVKILQEMGYEIHYAANFDVVVYGKDNSRLMGTGIHRHHIPFGRSPFSRDVRTCYLALKKLMLEEKFDLIHCHDDRSSHAQSGRESIQNDRKKSSCYLYRTWLSFL